MSSSSTKNSRSESLNHKLYHVDLELQRSFNDSDRLLFSVEFPCENNDLELLNKELSQWDIKHHVYWGFKAFYWIGFHGNLKMLEYIERFIKPGRIGHDFPRVVYNIDFANFHYVVRGACTVNNMNMVNYVVDKEKNGNDKLDILGLAVKTLSKWGYLESIKKLLPRIIELYNKDSDVVRYYEYRVDKDKVLERIYLISFEQACEGNQLDIIMYFNNILENTCLYRFYNSIGKCAYYANLEVTKLIIHLADEHGKCNQSFWNYGLSYVCYGIRKGGHNPICEKKELDWTIKHNRDRIEICKIMLNNGANPNEGLSYFISCDKTSPILKILLDATKNEENNITRVFAQGKPLTLERLWLFK